MSQTGDRADLRVLVAGAGLFGRAHLKALAGRPGVLVAGLADPSAQALDLARPLCPQAAAFPDARALIDRTPADALIVATPADSHVELASHALAAGLCVLLEKPVAPTAAAAADLLAISQSARGFVLPGHVLRFCADHRRLVDIVRSGEIGEPLYLNSRRYRDDSHALRYRDVDPILMTLIHDIDLARWIAGGGFTAVTARRAGGPGSRSMTSVSAATASGAICELRTAWTFASTDAPADRLEVVGTRGSVELVAGLELRLWSESRRLTIAAESGNDPLRNEQNHFLACVSDRSRALALGLPEAIEGLQLAETALAGLNATAEKVEPPSLRAQRSNPARP